jgi:ubiquinone/menaquinone biosynthesis C-methylase UbiE
VVGCGNSLLSEKLFKGLKLEKDTLLSIDFEDKVIKHMQNRGIEGIKYEKMDALNMTGLEDSSQNFVLDKGTLDALCADRSPETASKVIQYFNEIVRVLKSSGGVYICISLL